ncbi:hypothetical protein [Devosia rhizoryzae]|uniref:AsmA-like C-terminal domain-containing protein n=1 Tax=Devosia rhizoryzae TaxID=2774137 RepID=A0ABX7CC67_9HYPH|nr:hypothetical protein [Devosia rhizoryzae]QQR40794.1 hypothetical protein JI748_07325 [Devosia rhizoryzae]
MNQASSPDHPLDPAPTAKPRQRSKSRRAFKVAVWLLGVPCAILILLYITLLITPIRLPFTGPAIRGFVQSFIPPSADLTMGDMALALEGGVWPVIRFAPVQYRDSKSGAFIAMEALEVGFSPARALFGQPGTTITVVAPHVQIIQDLYGPRPGRFEVVEGENGAIYTIRVLEGEDAFPPIEISPSGIANSAGEAPPMRSDNDWLIYNLEASELALNDLVQQTELGRFSRLVVREAQIDMTDPVYGIYREIGYANLDIGLDAGTGTTVGEFSALIGGRTVVGSIERSLDEDGTRRLQADITNLDFSALMPFVDDRDAVAAMRGAGAVSIDVTFTGDTGKLIDGEFKIDLTGLDLRLEDDYFPIASSILDISWYPELGQFSLAEGTLQIGNSRAIIAGVFAMGLDQKYGPTVGMSIDAREVSINPNDLATPAVPFDTVEFSGWSAPLYGALGIDRLVARRGDASVATAGRIDLVQDGIGIDMSVAGQGITADDFKRLWPYIMGGESRDWFVANVPQGTVKNARMEFNFPVGAMDLTGGSDQPLPPDSMDIEIIGEGVAITATEAMPPIQILGETRIAYDGNFSVSGGGGRIETAGGAIQVQNPALVMDNTNPQEPIVEISGDVNAPIPALIALAQEQQPDALSAVELPIDLQSLSGTLDLGLVATIALADEEQGRPMKIDYVANGTVANFGSAEPIEGRTISNGQLSFSANQAGYQLGGTADIDGMVAEISVEGTPTTDPALRIASTVAVDDLAAMGFDASEFLSGQVQFVAQPTTDGDLQMSVDLEGAGLDIRDLGISKALGTPGTLEAIIRPDGEVTHLEDISLTFGDVRLAGGLDFHATDGLVSAKFDTFALSKGDSAQVALAPLEGGFDVTIRGAQLDLKPMLGRFFSLDTGSGGIETTQLDQSINLDVQLDRAIGFYATTAFNLDLDLALRNGELSRATLSAQFDEGNAISVTTNPAPNGRSLSVAFNDAGTILRLLGVYSQLAGGSGSLVMTTDRKQDVEVGQLALRNFAIVDESNVAQIVGNHADSRDAIARNNRLDFTAGEVTFVRRDKSVEVTNAVVAGATVGGNMRGFIYTDSGQYDLTGTFVPLFGLNNAFAQIPLLGPLLGGRDSEGLVGVTFAVRGPLGQPQFFVNPLSILAPGFLRELFQFRQGTTPAAQ